MFAKTAKFVKNEGEFSYLPPVKHCVECGSEIKMDNVWWRFAETMVEYKICQSCSHWIDQLLLRNENCVVVEENGQRHHYRIGEEVSGRSQWGKGYGGSKSVIRFFDGHVVTTTNLWHQGQIPERFFDHFPVNAEFVYSH
jgi:hypothetical protein